jgi:hypothetical protein
LPVSNLRPLDGVTREVLFYRPCKRCQQGFLYCRGREPGRRYCGEACANAASGDRVRKAQQNYRDSPEGRAQHRDEEVERRERHRLARVGDRRPEFESGELQIATTAVPSERAVEEERDVEPGKDKRVEWLLVVWPGLLAEAQNWLGTELACPCCDRRGIVCQVVELVDWRPEDTS